MGIVRRKKVDVAADIPARRIADIPVELDGESGRSIREAEAALVARLVERYRRLAIARPDSEPHDLIRMVAAAELEESKGSETGDNVFAMVRKIGQAKATPAADFTVNLARNVGKVVFFAKHIDVMDAAEAHFKAAGLKTVSIRGEQTAKARTAALDGFTNDPDVAVAVCSLLTAGVGINLQAASNVVLAELSWTNAEQTQAIDRVHRIGQELPVTAWRIIAAGTIDGRISELIDSKAGLAARALDGEDALEAAAGSVQLEALVTLLDATRVSPNSQLSSETSRLAGVVHLPVTSSSLRNASSEVTEGPSGLDEPPDASQAERGIGGPSLCCHRGIVRARCTPIRLSHQCGHPQWGQTPDVAIRNLMSALVGGLAAAVISSSPGVGIRGYPAFRTRHRRQYLTARRLPHGPVPREAQHPSMRATYGLLMAGDKKHPPKAPRARAPTRDGSSALMVGLAIGVSLGVAMANIAVGIAIGIGIGIAFGLAFTRSKNAQDGSRYDDESDRRRVSLQLSPREQRASEASTI